MKKKNKNIAGFLALFFGWFGAHRFYLGQTDRGWFFTFLTGMALFGARIPVIGRILAVAWIPLVAIIALVDAIVFFSMDKGRFDEKYNGIPYDGQDRSTDFERRKSDTDFERTTQKREREHRPFHQQRKHRQELQKEKQMTHRQKTSPRQNHHNKLGKQKFAEYDYEGAIKEFEKSLEFNPSDIAALFNLACAHSLMENVDRSFYNLELAVAHGFRDFKKIHEHHALAYLRIQDEFEPFVQNGYRMPRKDEAPKEQKKEDLLSSEPDLLDQLNKLAEMREKGFLTEKEFEVRKDILMQKKQ